MKEAIMTWGLTFSILGTLTFENYAILGYGGGITCVVALIVFIEEEMGW